MREWASPDEPCNCLATWGSDDPQDWGPVIRRGEKFYDCRGLLIMPPLKWRDATPVEIQAHLDKNDIIVITKIGAAT